MIRSDAEAVHADLSAGRLPRRAEQDTSAADLAAPVLMCLSEAVVVADPSGRIALFNEAAERLYQMPAASVLGRCVTDALADPDTRDDGAGWPPSPEAAEVPARPSVVRHRRGDGTVFDAEVRLAAVRHGDGTTLGLAGVVRDVTAEPAAVELLRAVVDAAAEAIIGVDEHDVVWFFSPAAERLYGWRAEEVVGSSIWRLASDHPRLQPYDVGADVHAGRVVHRETVVRRKDGARLAVRLTASPVIGRDGAYAGAVVTGLDLSELRRGEADSARLAALVHAAPDAIITVDRDAVIASWNPGAERMFGLPAALAVGRRYAAVVVPDSERAEYRELRAGVLAGRTATLRMRGRRADGSLFPTEVSAAPLTAPNGSNSGAVAIVRDITRLAEAELSLRERAGQLERSNSELEEFAYAASHDLQEPLRSITMGVETVMRSAAARLDDDEQALLAHVEAASARMSAQVGALMDLAQVALGESREAPVPVQLALGDALDALRVAACEAKLVVDVPGSLPAAAVPRAELTLVLQNLLANAIKYAQPGVRPRVTVSGSVHDDVVEIRVADNGIGLIAADRARIFAVFGRAHPEVPGTGMGLALCRRILERRSGSISVTSAGPGRGSEFVLRLPAGQTGDRPT